MIGSYMSGVDRLYGSTSGAVRRSASKVLNAENFELRFRIPLPDPLSRRLPRQCTYKKPKISLEVHLSSDFLENRALLTFLE